MDARDAPTLRFEILGRLRAWRGEQELDLGPGKQQAVLAVLLLTPNRPVPTTAIVDAVWGEDPPDNGANVVQKYVAGLRRVLEPDRSPRAPARVLQLTSAGYVLHVPPDGLDAEVFQKRVRGALAARAGAADAAETIERLGEALAMWRETPLAGLTGPVFDAARERLVEDRAAALETCAEVELDLGRHARLVPELIRLVNDFPLREGARYLLMLALYRSGRQAEALAAYRDAREFLAEEFGVEPGERLQNLHLRILRSDPALLNWQKPPVQDPVGSTPGPNAPQAVPAATPPAWTPMAGAALARRQAVERTERQLRVGLRIIAIAVPIFTCGTLSWAVVAYLAGRRRSPWLALAGVAWLALSLFSWLTIGTGTEELRPIDDVAMVAGMIAAIGGAVHVAVLTGSGWPSHKGGADEQVEPDPHVVELIERRTRREQARALLLHHPSIARDLHIGRPDLPRTFDDGGLVDVNSAPEHVLALLPGLGFQNAKLIVTVREVQGPFASIDELIARGVVPPEVIQSLYEVLVVLPPPVDTPTTGTPAAGTPEAGGMPPPAAPEVIRP